MGPLIWRWRRLSSLPPSLLAGPAYSDEWSDRLLAYKHKVFARCAISPSSLPLLAPICKLIPTVNLPSLTKRNGTPLSEFWSHDFANTNVMQVGGRPGRVVSRMEVATKQFECRERDYSIESRENILAISCCRPICRCIARRKGYRDR